MLEIRNIVAAYLRAANNKLALASVVYIDQSSYRRIGARMLVTENGDTIGGISGGCLEGDALKRAKSSIISGKTDIATYDTLDADNHTLGIGLGCNGLIEVLFSPINNENHYNECHLLQELVDRNEEAVMLKCLTKNSEKFGEAIVCYSEKETDEFLGCKETDLRQLIVTTITNRRSHVVELLDKAGQRQRILVEYFRPSLRLIIIGDNYDINPMVTTAHGLGWEITIIGKRSKITKASYQLCKSVISPDEASTVRIDRFTAVVLMSHDYQTDKALLPYFLQQRPAYLGMLGPHKRRQRMLEELAIDHKNLSLSLHAPIGLDLGAETPEEIAIAITAEIIACSYQRQGGFLKDTKNSIH